MYQAPFLQSFIDVNLANTVTGFSGTKNTMVYLVGTLNGNTFTVDNDIHGGERTGGFGSTGNTNIFTKEEFTPNLFNNGNFDSADIIQNDIVTDSRPEWDKGIL